MPIVERRHVRFVFEQRSRLRQTVAHIRIPECTGFMLSIVRNHHGAGLGQRMQKSIIKPTAAGGVFLQTKRGFFLIDRPERVGESADLCVPSGAVPTADFPQAVDVSIHASRNGYPAEAFSDTISSSRLPPWSKQILCDRHVDLVRSVVGLPHDLAGCVRRDFVQHTAPGLALDTE